MGDAYVNNCPHCGALMKQLFNSFYCPNDCDRRNNKQNSVNTIQTWVIDYAFQPPWDISDVSGETVTGDVYSNVTNRDDISFFESSGHLIVIAAHVLQTVTVFSRLYPGGKKYQMCDSDVLSVSTE